MAQLTFQIVRAGKYPDKPALPAVPGNECLAEIVALGPAVPAALQLRVGDRIIPRTTQTGTWRTHSTLPAAAVQRVPADLDAVAAATLTVNPPTAYRMLRDFVRLQQGDTVIQNGGNSAVGQAVSQLCRIWGLNCVSVVRDRPDIGALRAYLCRLGATAVLTEAEVRTTELFRSGRVPKPRLALNCVGGKSATEMLRHLGERGQLVTYGAMSREPVTAPNAALIFKDIAFRGFWMSRWSRENAGSAQREEMLHELIGWYADGQLCGPEHRLVPFAEWERAVGQALDFKGFAGAKFILQF